MRGTPFEKFTPSVNIPFPFTLSGLYYQPEREHEGKTFAAQCSITGLMRGQKTRVYLPLWCATKLVELAIATPLPDEDGQPRWQIREPVDLTITKGEPAPGRRAYRWTFDSPGAAPERTPPATDTPPAQSGPETPEERPARPNAPTPDPQAPQTDRRRVTAIMATYKAAWIMAGEIMGTETVRTGPGGTGVKEVDHPDQHAAAATLFIQMCRQDQTMVWAEKGARLEIVREDQQVIETARLLDLENTIEELKAVAKDAGVHVDG